MPNIIIGSTVIDFPSSGADANWAPATIEFAQTVSDVLAGLVSAFDISPRVEVLANDANVGYAIPSAAFPNLQVRSFVFSYSIYRTNGVTTLSETGTIFGVYNKVPSPGVSEWMIEHQFSGPRQANGNQYHTFYMTNDQIYLDTVALGGAYDNLNSKISYSAKTLLVSNLT